MKHRLFKTEVPKDPIIQFIKDNFILENNVYFLDHMIFRKLMFEGIITSFIESIQTLYHKSKQHYVTDVTTYKMFLTVLRQLLNYHNITFTKDIKYANNTYNIIYFIHIE